MIITIGRKPFDGSVSENTSKYETGGLDIDSCRLATAEVLARHKSSGNITKWHQVFKFKEFCSFGHPKGRFPANVIVSITIESTLNNQGKLTANDKNPCRYFKVVGKQ